MRHKQITLLNFFGVEIKVDVSWLFLVLLVMWTLSMGYFPQQLKGEELSTYWAMGLVGAFGLFVSLILHELAHTFTARRLGLPIKGITLFIFGGVAEMEREPDEAWTELIMAAAGPLMSITLSGGFYILTLTGASLLWSERILTVFSYLWQINLILALFNLLPGFPLDGGRILRSVLWLWKKNFRIATHWAVRSGSWVGTLLMLFGVLNFVTGNFIAGIWWFLIAFFLKGAARASEYQTLMKEFFKGDVIEQHMNPFVISIEPSTTLDRALKDYFYRFHHHHFPVVESGKLLGVFSISDLKKVPENEWAVTRVDRVYTDLSESVVVSSHTNALDTFKKMQKEGKDLLLVIDSDVNHNPQLKGVISMRDLFGFVSIHQEIEANSKG